MHHTTVQINTDFPDFAESELITKICLHKDINNKEAHISAFKRFGFSGAKIILLHYGKHPGIGWPDIVKKSRYTEIKKEFDAIEALRNKFKDLKLVTNELFVTDNEEWGALVYEYYGNIQGNEHDTKIVKETFREIIYDTENYEDERILEVLSAVLYKISKPREEARWRTSSFENIYSKYLRDHKKFSVQRIQSILGNKSMQDKTCRFLGCEILNPTVFLSSLPDQMKVPVGPIHGDLHLDNIVINEGAGFPYPHLIDFEWGKLESDVLIDYVLFENSLRFMCFPKKENLKEQLNVEKCYLENDIDKILRMNFSSKEKRHLYRRQAKLVKLLREKALMINGGISFERYLLTQFIVLYGLMRYEDSYSSYIPVRTLGLIAKKLNNFHFPNDDE